MIESSHPSGFRNKRQIGEAVVLVLYFLIDGYEIWPNSHLLALASAAIGAIVICFIEMPTKWWVGSTAAIMAIVAAIYFAAGPMDDLDAPKLSVDVIELAGGQPLSSGPLAIQWQVTNSGHTSAKIAVQNATPLLLAGPRNISNESFSGKLPDTPIYGTARRTLLGLTINPGNSLHLVSPPELTLTQEQVDAINAGTTRLYFYGYFRYGRNSEFRFIGVYMPHLVGQNGMFVRDDQEYPTYSRTE